MTPLHKVLLIALPSLTAALIYFAVTYQPWFVLSDRAPSKRQAFLGLLLGTTVPFLAVCAYCYPRYLEVLDIRDHGQRAVAEVRKIHRESTKTSIGYRVEYRYVASERDGIRSYFIGNGWLPTVVVTDVERSGQVPIAYATDNPSSSMMNYDDYAFSQALNDERRLILFLALLPAIIIGPTVAFLFKNNAIERKAA